MKYIYIALALALGVVSCSKNENEMHLTGHIAGLKKGKIILQKVNDTLIAAVDSITVNGDASFSFVQTIASPEIYFLHLQIEHESLLDKSIPFFAEAGAITINSTLENFTLGSKITGSKNQIKYEEYKKLIQRYIDKNLVLIEEEFSALQNQNDSILQEVRSKRQNLIRGKYLATVNYAINNKDYEVSPYLMLTEVYDANVKYLDTVFQSLTPKIKDSKYGKELESYIAERKLLLEN